MAKTKAQSVPETSSNPKPAAIVRQGNLKCVLWRNPSENGPWYTADLVRTFKTESGFQETSKIPADDLLRVAFLAQQAFGQLQQLKAQDRAETNEAPHVPAQP